MLELWQDSMLVVAAITIVVVFGFARYRLLLRAPSFQEEQAQAFLTLFAAWLFFSVCYVCLPSQQLYRIGGAFLLDGFACFFLANCGLLLSFLVGTILGTAMRKHNPIATPSS